MQVGRHSQKCGWLHKRGGRIQTWHKRWFVLTGDLLFYYKTPQDPRPTGTIPLAGNDITRHADDLKHIHSFKFEITAGSGRDFITSTHDSYLIAADTSDEADLWVAAIKRVLHEPFGGGMFGRDLKETMKVEARLGGTYIPIFVHRCCKFILENGIEETGIFRLPGQTSRVQSLKKLYDNGCQFDISVNEDVHTVASLLKLYLRELPQPLIPFEMFDNAVKISRTLDNEKNDLLATLDKFLKELPKHNFNLLKYLCRFLSQIAEYSDKNKMTIGNLATVFGPNIMRPEFPKAENLIESSNASANFIGAIIRLQKELFPYTADDRPPKRLSIVNSSDIMEFIAKTSTNKPGGSLFVKSGSPKPETMRGRVGSVPGKLPLSPIDFHKIKGKKFNNGLDSPRTTRRSKKFLASNDAATYLDSSSGRISPIMSGSPRFEEEEDDDDDESSSTTILSGSENPFSPEINIHTLDESVEVGRDRLETGDTISPDVLVNSITKEMESLERQLQALKDTLSKKRKESRLWKARYYQERRARVAAQERIQNLQQLVDQTFDQFALDDSEDDDYEDSISDYSNPNSPAAGDISNINPLSIPHHVRHIRAQSIHLQ